MTKPRETMLIIGSGRRRIGKSNYTLKMLLDYIKIGRPVLIFDTNNEYASYELDGDKNKAIQIKAIKHKDIAVFSALMSAKTANRPPEIRRIIPVKENGDAMSELEVKNLLIQALREFKNGMFFIEDINAIFGDSLPLDLTAMLVNIGHRGCDLLFHIQSVGRLLPKFLQNANGIRFHYQLDSVDESKGKLKDSFEIFKIAQNIVNTQYLNGNIRFCVYICKDEYKILAVDIENIITYKMAYDACKEYVEEYPSATRKYKKLGKNASSIAISDLLGKYFKFSK